MVRELTGSYGNLEEIWSCKKCYQRARFIHGEGAVIPSPPSFGGQTWSAK